MHTMPPNSFTDGKAMTQILPNDIARCDGRYTELEGSREIFDRPVKLVSVECSGCLRRTAPRPDTYWNMEPPTFEGKCPKKIEPKENNGN